MLLQEGLFTQQTEDFINAASAASHHLEEKWELLEMKCKSFQKLKNDFFQQQHSEPKASNDEIIRLNCGGTNADLNKCTSSELQITLQHFFFSSAWNHFLLKDNHNRTYVDLDISWMKPIFRTLTDNADPLNQQRKDVVPINSINYSSRAGYKAAIEYLQMGNNCNIKATNCDNITPTSEFFHTTTFPPLFNIQAKELIYQLIIERFPQFARNTNPAQSSRILITPLFSIASNAHTSCPINITNHNPLLILYYVDEKVFGALHSLDNGWTIEKWQTNVALFTLDGLFSTTKTSSKYMIVSCYMQPDSISYCQSSNATTTVMFIPFHHKREKGGYYNERFLPFSSTGPSIEKEKYSFFQSNLRMEIYWIHQESDEEIPYAGLFWD